MTEPVEATFVTSDGLRLSGRHLLAADAPAATVVVVHGFTASARCPNVEELARRLHESGFDVLAYDARGHGSSDGESTLGDHEQHDVAGAVALARERTERVVLVGASMGAIAAIRYAVTDAGLAGLVAVSCPAEWRLPCNARGVLAAVMTRTPVGRRLVGRLSGVRVASRWTNPLPPLALVPALATPTVFVHGDADRFIGVRDAALLHAAAPEPKHLVVVPDMGHAFGPPGVGAIVGAVDWVLASGRVSR